jgi:hypothetical protein
METPSTPSTPSPSPTSPSTSWTHSGSGSGGSSCTASPTIALCAPGVCTRGGGREGPGAPHQGGRMHPLLPHTHAHPIAAHHTCRGSSAPGGLGQPGWVATEGARGVPARGPPREPNPTPHTGGAVGAGHRRVLQATQGGVGPVGPLLALRAAGVQRAPHGGGGRGGRGRAHGEGHRAGKAGSGAGGGSEPRPPTGRHHRLPRAGLPVPVVPGVLVPVGAPRNALTCRKVFTTKGQRCVTIGPVARHGGGAGCSPVRRATYGHTAGGGSARLGAAATKGSTRHWTRTQARVEKGAPRGRTG